MKRVVFILSVVFAVHVSGCDGMPHQECTHYVDCVAHFEDVNGLAQTDSSETYGNWGTCWQTVESSDTCVTDCVNGLADLKDELEAAGEDVGACG